MKSGTQKLWKYIGLSSAFKPGWTGTHVLDARHTLRSHFYTKKNSEKSKTANNLIVILRAVNFLKKTSQKHMSFTDKSPVDHARACTGALRHARTPQPAHKKKSGRGSASRGRAPTPGPRNLNENPASEKLSGKSEKQQSKKGSWKRALSGRGQTFKNDDGYTLSAVF